MSYITDRFDDDVVRLLEKGGIGFMPSDTIYGLSCLALNRDAVEKIHKTKLRDDNKPFIVLISNIGQLEGLGVDKSLAKPVADYWPGALSAVLPSGNIPAWLERGKKSLAVRLPANNPLTQLIDRVGPIISTSANLQGQPPINTVSEAQAIFGGQLDFYVDGGKLDGLPSTVVEVSDGRLTVLRKGAVTIG